MSVCFGRHCPEFRLICYCLMTPTYLFIPPFRPRIFSCFNFFFGMNVENLNQTFWNFFSLFKSENSWWHSICTRPGGSPISRLLLSYIYWQILLLLQFIRSFQAFHPNSILRMETGRKRSKKKKEYDKDKDVLNLRVQEESFPGVRLWMPW